MLCCVCKRYFCMRDLFLEFVYPLYKALIVFLSLELKSGMKVQELLAILLVDMEITRLGPYWLLNDTDEDFKF